MNKHTSSVSLIDGHTEDRTDAEIIKALNGADGLEHISVYCANNNGEDVCSIKLVDIIDLINRQQAEIKQFETIERFATKTIEKQTAEIEKLHHEILSCNTKIEVLQEVKEQLEKDVFNAQMNCDSIAYDYELLKQEKSVVQFEAIKEFAERLKQKYDKPLFYLGSYEQFMREVDNLVKEMKEVKE